jgi:hypothetical protein
MYACSTQPTAHLPLLKLRDEVWHFVSASCSPSACKHGIVERGALLLSEDDQRSTSMGKNTRSTE